MRQRTFLRRLKPLERPVVQWLKVFESFMLLSVFLSASISRCFSFEKSVFCTLVSFQQRFQRLRFYSVHICRNLKTVHLHLVSLQCDVCLCLSRRGRYCSSPFLSFHNHEDDYQATDRLLTFFTRGPKCKEVVQRDRCQQQLTGRPSSTKVSKVNKYWR